MKMKKTMASIAAVAMAASMVSAFSMSASAIAEGTKIDFEDGDCSFVYMNVDDGADASVLSVEDYDGSKQLKVDVQQTGKVPKVWFDLDKITARENTLNIATIELDMTFVPKSETEMVGWAGGVLCSAGGFDQNNTQASQINPAWSQTDWACEDENAYTEGMPAKVHATKKFLLPSTKYSEEGVNPFFGIMRWASDYNYVMYVDNIVLKDKDGNALPVGVFAAAEEAPAEEAATEDQAAAETTEAVTEATEAATEAAAVEEEAAPVEEASSVDLFALQGTVISDTESTSSGEWGQAITLTTIKNENGVFDPAVLTSDKAVVVYYEADTAPEVVLQSWSGGEGWAKVPASADLSVDGAAVYTWEDMAAVYQSEDFSATLDSFIVGDTGSALKVTKVLLVDAASLTGEAAPAVTEAAPVETAAPAQTEAAPAETAAPVSDAAAPVAPTGNASAAAVAAVMAVAGAAALIAKRK